MGRRIQGIDLRARPACMLAIAMLAACGPAAWSVGPPDPRATAACPRDSSKGASGRCACETDDLPLLGACVPPAVGDAFCGLAARMGADGCVFRLCPVDEAIDVATGYCLARTTLGHEGPSTCGEASAPIVESGRIECVPPDATCPRGTHREGASCARGSGCPPGTLPDGNACRTIVTAGRGPVHVDMGTWAALAIGVDGGLGGGLLCRPLLQRPGAFGLEPGASATLNIRIGLVAPDQDVSRVSATVAADTGGRPLPPAGLAVVGSAVAPMVEAFRSLGGVSNAEAIAVDVRCGLALP